MAKEISMAEVKKHRTEKSIWVVIQNDVYDLTKFLNQHPAGPEVLLEVAGQDATQPFQDVGHSNDAKEMMKTYKIGSLPAGEKNKFVDRCSNLKWALIALAGALVIGFAIKKYAT